MNVLTAERLSLAFGPVPQLDAVSFTLQRGERVCLLGRNGEGKSSLLRILEGRMAADDGRVILGAQVKIATLPQELPVDDHRTAYAVVASAFAELGELLERYDALTEQAAHDASALKALEQVQARIEAQDGWSAHRRISQLLEQYQIDPHRPLSEFSGGWQRRVLLARAMAVQPDLLLLDEPTNHLDVPAIQWLEQALLGFQGAILFVSHDRAFIRSMATRILELDRGHLTSWDAGYDRYLELKEKRLEEEEKQWAEFDRKLAQEETWIRQGVKARRTRNMGRVRALLAMRDERRQRRERGGRAEFSVEAAERSGKLVAEAKAVEFAYPGQPPIIRDFNFVLMRGDKVGLIGENGSGKTTLLRLLLGQLQPTSGQIRQGTQVEVAYFDQRRADLDMEKNAIDNLSEGREFIEINGQRKHIMGYLADFLFTPERARTPVRVLSGGERARLLLARLFSKPANVLVLDEPTNDLDIETLELLEARLVDFPGTVILISHDREFLDNVVGSTLSLDGTGRVVESVGGYEDWRRQGGRFASEQPVAKPAEVRKADNASQGSGGSAPRKSNKLSYKFKIELEGLPARIQAQESAVAKLQADVSAPDFYQRDHALVTAQLAALAEAEAALDQLVTRWVELEELAADD